MKSILYSILTSSFLPLITAYGQATVINQCPFPVNLWVVSSTQGPMLTLPSGGDLSHTYEINPAGGGISIKLTPDLYITNQITQFEYTLAGPEIYYDISDVNGSPFEPYGLTLTSSDASCHGVMCMADSTCATMIYNQPEDNFATEACGNGADLTLMLCDGSNVIQSPPAAMPTPTSATFPAPSTPNVPAVTTTQTPATTSPASVPCDTTMQTPPTTFPTPVISVTTAHTPPATSAYPNAYQPAWPAPPGVSIATTFVTRVQTFTDAITEVVTATVT